MSDYETQAAGYIRQAEAKLKKGIFKKPDTDSAIEFYEKAGNYYKMAKNYTKAGESYMKCADLYVSSGKPQMAVNLYTTAAATLKEDNPEASNAAFLKMITAAKESGRFMQAGKAMRELAESLEDQGKEEKAYVMYKDALDLFSKEASATTEIRGCKEHIAELTGRINGNYAESSRLLEEIGIECTKIQLLQFHARGYFLTAFLCLCVSPDKVTLDLARERYASVDPTFNGSFECDFMTQASEAIENTDIEALADATAKLKQRLGTAFSRSKFRNFLFEKVLESMQPTQTEDGGVEDYL